MPTPQQKDLLCLVNAWMHFAGGETSAGRPGTTRMMFLAVFYGRSKNIEIRTGLPVPSQGLDQSAIHGQIDAIDVARCGAGQKGNRIGNLGRLGKPPQRDIAPHALGYLFYTLVRGCRTRPDDGGQAIGFRGPRQYIIYRDLVRPQL